MINLNKAQQILSYCLKTARAIYARIKVNRVLTYVVCWLILLTFVVLYFKANSIEGGNDITILKDYINRGDTDTKLEALQKLYKKEQFSLLPFPFIKAYQIVPKMGQDSLAVDDGPVLFGDKFIYSKENKAEEKSDLNLYNLSTLQFENKLVDNADGITSLHISDDAERELFVEARVTGENNILKLINTDTDGKVSIRYYKDPKSFLGEPASPTILTGAPERDYFGISYNETAIVFSPITVNLNDAKNNTLKNVFNKASGKIIGMALPGEAPEKDKDKSEIYVLRTDSSKKNSLMIDKWSRYNAGGLSNTPIAIKIPFGNLTKDNTILTATRTKSNIDSKVYLSIAQFLPGKVNVCLVSISAPIAKVVGNNSFSTNVDVDEFKKTALISTGENLYLTYDNQPFCRFKNNFTGKRNNGLYNIEDITDLGTDNRACWYSDNGICVLGRGADGIYRFVNDTLQLFTPTKNDSIALKNVGSFAFLAQQSAKEPTFIGISAYNRTIVKLVRPVDGVPRITILDGIHFDENVFTYNAKIDYYYVIVLVITLITAFLIGLIFVKAPPKEKLLAVESVTLVPTYTEKFKGVKKAAEALKFRSDMMLVLGILFGTSGVVTASILFSSSSVTIGDLLNPKSIISLLKPVLLLVFIETFTFFFLKQYRIIFNEYKLFYSIYLKLYNFFHVLQLNDIRAANFNNTAEASVTQSDDTANDIPPALQNAPTASDQLFAKLIDSLLAEKYELYESKTISAINEFDSASILKIVELMSKGK
jgi:hypothetical protein